MVVTSGDWDDVKHPKPLTKLKVRCYKAAIESGTWRSPFEKWPKLPPRENGRDGG